MHFHGLRRKLIQPQLAEYYSLRYCSVFSTGVHERTTRVKGIGRNAEATAAKRFGDASLFFGGAVMHDLAKLEAAYDTIMVNRWRRWASKRSCLEH